MKKFFNLLMVLVVFFCSCDNGSTSTEPPAPVNNFNGKTFIGMTGEGEEAYFASYIVFTSDKDCEVMFFDEAPMPATYTVADDVATLKGTGEYAALQLSTTKLTDGKFSITIPPAVSKEEEDIVVSYAVGTLWTILYDIPESDEDFSLKMPEEELEAAVEHYGFVEADYDKNDATKTVTLTASGWAKVRAAMGSGSSTGGNTETPETPANTTTPVTAEFLQGKTFYSTVTILTTTSAGPLKFAETGNTCQICQPVPAFDEEGNPDGYDYPWVDCEYTIVDGVAKITTETEGLEELELTIPYIKADGTFDIEYPAILISEEAANAGLESITLSYFPCSNGFVGKVWDGEYAVVLVGDLHYVDEEGNPRVQDDCECSYTGWIELDFISTSKVVINYDTTATYTVSGNTAAIVVPEIGTFSITTDSTINIPDNVIIDLFLMKDHDPIEGTLENGQIKEKGLPPTIECRW